MIVLLLGVSSTCYSCYTRHVCVCEQVPDSMSHCGDINDIRVFYLIGHVHPTRPHITGG